MKQLLFTIVTLVTINTSLVQDVKPYEQTTWNVIRERLFSGENSKAFRFEEDIRLQLIGAKTQQDSVVITKMISELNGLLKTVQLKMVDTDPNFKLDIDIVQGGNNFGATQRFSGSEILSTDLKIGIPYDFNESVNYIYYYTIRHLTKLYTPEHGTTNYGGIFDSKEAAQATFKEIDRDLLKKLYAPDFYKNLKKNTVQKSGFQSYLYLRYRELVRNLWYALKAIILLLGFLFFLSKESKRKKIPSLLQYIKQRLVILIALPFFFSFITTSGYFSILLIDTPAAFLTNTLGIVICGLLVLVFLYYTEPPFLKKINNFAGKQAFVFISTLVATLIVSTVLGFLFIKYSGYSLSLVFNPASFWIQDSSNVFLVTFIAALRVFYNFVAFRIQSMVNQKDVEIAKMKELKNQAELHALHSRINPHFLYNSLNAIASLAHIDPDKTENMATGLSELFRYSINKGNKTYVTVAEELEMSKKYLEIEKTRFGNKLEYEINADEETLEKQIPKFLIQPLVENAVKHGHSKIKGSGKIVVEVKQLEKNLSISIFDNGPDFPEEPVSGYGLQNLYDKLDIIYGNDAVIKWNNGENKNFTIILKNQF